MQHSLLVILSALTLERIEYIQYNLYIYTSHGNHCAVSQILHGYVYNYTAGRALAFSYRPCYDCGDLINSVYYKEYLQSDRDSTSALQKVSQIVSSSTDFQQLAGCASAQFSAKWAFEVTWIEAGDDVALRNRGGSDIASFTATSLVSVVH